jgi:pyruvate/2-oxoglutarate dehydrogenase complex dihydrolipoamide dehydrogenase (E3) component
MTLATQPKSMIIVGGAIELSLHTLQFHGNWSNHCRIYAKYSSVEDEDISKQMERSWKKSRNQNHETRLLRELILGAGVKHLWKRQKEKKFWSRDLTAVGIKTNIENID